MPPITEQSAPQGNIMVVDDNPANLKLLGRHAPWAAV